MEQGPSQHLSSELGRDWLCISPPSLSSKSPPNATSAEHECSLSCGSLTKAVSAQARSRTAQCTGSDVGCRGIPAPGLVPLLQVEGLKRKETQRPVVAAVGCP